MLPVCAKLKHAIHQAVSVTPAALCVGIVVVFSWDWVRTELMSCRRDSEID